MMREFTEEMDRMFRAAPGTKLQAWVPAVDVHQCDGNLVVTLAMRAHAPYFFSSVTSAWLIFPGRGSV